MRKILIIAGFLVVAFGVALIVRLTTAVPSATIKITSLPQKEYNPEVWGKYYPLEYESFRKNSVMAESPTGYGGSVNRQKSLKEPEILVNFKGMAFSKDYAEDRGHVFALEDIRNTKRLSPQTTGSCITCKTADLIDLWQEKGWGYAQEPISKIFQEVRHSITCANCHDPKTMKLRVVNPAFIEAMKSRGIDTAKASQQEMRAFVCGQCHVEYYFEPESKKVVLPWGKGLDPEQMYAYYSEKPACFKQDWLHPDSQVRMLKAQHPDFETWSAGVHGRAGVGCPDCHMPYERHRGQKYSSHWVTSPLRSIENSCGTCHDQTKEWLLQSVKSTQQKVWQLQRLAGVSVAQAHEALKRGASKGRGTDAEKAGELLRRAQWYWDCVAAENSMGFHNPTQTLNILGQSIQLSNEAIRTAAGHP